MNYETLFNVSGSRLVRAALVGSGEFGVSFIFQAERAPNLEVAAVCDRSVQKAIDGYVNAGIAEDAVVVCETSDEAHAAMEAGKRIVVSDFRVLMGLPLDVLVEGTGNPETGAAAADLALESGIHVVMVSKEVDSVVGPVLCAKARKAGLVYTTGEGDQPSLLIGLISWARALGLDIVAAGKSSEYDFVYRPSADTLVCNGREIKIPGFGALWEKGDGKTAAQLAADRHAMLAELPHRSIPDLCEMCVVANATGMLPDAPMLHAPSARIVELPDMMALAAEGGILDRKGRLDIFNCLRKPDEVSMAGGVFIVVSCDDGKSWDVLAAKGHLVSGDGKRALIYHPAHLLGVEAPVSVMAAAVLGQATGGERLYPHCDLVGRAIKHLEAGTLLNMGGHHHVIDGVGGELIPSMCRADDAAVPFYMLAGATLVKDVPAGSTITYAHIKRPATSVLWRLRAEQENMFPLFGSAP